MESYLFLFEEGTSRSDLGEGLLVLEFGLIFIMTIFLLDFVFDGKFAVHLYDLNMVRTNNY